MYIRPTDENIETWENTISEFAKDNSIIFKANSDITAICKSLGFSVLSMQNDAEVVDGIILVNKSNKIIGVNNSRDFEDTRFIIAHELSHYISKRTTQAGNLKFAFKDKHIFGVEKDEVENQMDYMAAAILVPRKIFKNYLDKWGIPQIRDINEVKENVDPVLVDFLSYVFKVKQDVICRRIIEVS